LFKKPLNIQKFFA